MSNEIAERPARERKTAWQRESRRAFVREHGYGHRSHYGAGGNRALVLERDGHACVRCGMTDEQHRERWDRPITIDHKDKDRSNNSLMNLQTLCLSCHGRKDLLPRLCTPQVPKYKPRITQMRHDGATYQHIADTLGFSIGAIYKWCKKWGIA